VSADWHVTDEPYLIESFDEFSGDAPDRRPSALGRRDAWVRRRRDLGYLLALIAAVGLVVAHDHRSSPLPPVPSGISHAPPVTPDALGQLIVEAHLPGPLSDYVRAAATGPSCTLVPSRSSPRSAITAAIHRALPNLALVDSSETLDVFAALCSIEVRARDHAGTIAVVSVASPSEKPSSSPSDQISSMDIVSESRGTISSTLISAATRRGWKIRVGATGRSSDLPAERTLVALAKDPQLRW